MFFTSINLNTHRNVYYIFMTFAYSKQAKTFPELSSTAGFDEQSLN